MLSLCESHGHKNGESEEDSEKRTVDKEEDGRIVAADRRGQCKRCFRLALRTVWGTGGFGL